MLRVGGSYGRGVPSMVRQISGTAVVMAAKKPAAKAGAKGGKPKMTGKTKSSFAPQKQQTKVKKGGMTHYSFGDAVRELKFEKLAKTVPVDTLDVSKLSTLKGSVVKYTPSILSKMNTLNVFKKFQHHELFETPISLISENCHKLNQTFIEKLNSNGSHNNRICLIGEKGIGKSTLLAQTIALASSKYGDDIILLHVDKPENIGNGTSDYIFNESLGKYQQPMFTKRWIWKLKQVNEPIFKKLKLSQDITFQANRVDHHLKKDINSIYDFLQANLDFGKYAPTEAFQFLVKELIHHSKNVPIMVSIDNVNGIVDNAITEYKTPSFKPIHVTDFEMGDFFIKLMSGELKFDKGGILMAQTKDFGEFLTTLDVSLGIKQYDPYARSKFFDLAIANRLLSNGGVKPFHVKNLTKDESKNLLQFYKDQGVLQVRDYAQKPSTKSLRQESQLNLTGNEFDSDEQFKKLINSHFTVSSGNPGYLLKATVLNY